MYKIVQEKDMKLNDNYIYSHKGKFKIILGKISKDGRKKIISSENKMDEIKRFYENLNLKLFCEEKTFNLILENCTGNFFFEIVSKDKKLEFPFPCGKGNSFIYSMNKKVIIDDRITLEKGEVLISNSNSLKIKGKDSSIYWGYTENI